MYFSPPIEETSFFDRWRPLKKTETNENAVIESGPSGCTCKLAVAPKAQRALQEKGEKYCKSERNRVCCETVSPSKTHEVSQA